MNERGRGRRQFLLGAAAPLAMAAPLGGQHKSGEKSAQPDSMIGYLKTVDAATLANAIELLNVRPRAEGFTPWQIRCLFPELGRMCGYAVTAQVETVTQTEPINPGVLMELFEAVGRAPKPSVVALQEIGGYPNRAAHCGEVMSTVFKRQGGVGVVSDAAVRDIAEVRAMGFHYFARGAVASHANFRIVRVGVPVQIDGMEIRPGDVLHGDLNGLITVPKSGVEKLPQLVDQVRSMEKKIFEFVRGPDFSMEGFRKMVLKH